MLTASWNDVNALTVHWTLKYFPQIHYLHNHCFKPSISLDILPNCIIKCVVIPWILLITTLKSTHLLTNSFFASTRPFSSKWCLKKHTISVPGFLWWDGLSIVISNFLHELRDKPSLIPSTLQWGSANQILHSLSIANIFLSFLFPSFK